MGTSISLTFLNGPKLRLGVGAVSRYVYREKPNCDKWTSEDVHQARATAAFVKCYVAIRSNQKGMKIKPSGNKSQIALGMCICVQKCFIIFSRGLSAGRLDADFRRRARGYKESINPFHGACDPVGTFLNLMFFRAFR